MELLSDVQRLHLSQQLQQLQQQQGVTLQPGSWAEALVAEAGT
jgi:hypothetical protein